MRTKNKQVPAELCATQRFEHTEPQLQPTTRVGGTHVVPGEALRSKVVGMCGIDVQNRALCKREIMKKHTLCERESMKDYTLCEREIFCADLFWGYSA